MDKLKMHSLDMSQENIDKIMAVFPNCVTEKKDENGNIVRAVDFDLLRQELSDHIVEGPDERYRLDWPGKRKALFTANAPIAKTLRPVRDESVDFDTTKNLFIEGDNLDALKLLQETYLNKVKMIYIDPPYNTGHDFIYNDDFAEDKQAYLERSNQVDEDSNRLVTNNDSNGRFHSDWLSMMYPRLKLARNLLRDDGVIFISISDREQANLKKLCDQVFGEENFLCCVVWNSTKSITNTALISVNHTYNFIYAKNINYFIEHREHFRLDETGEGFSNPDNDPRGAWKADPFQVGGWRPNQQYEIINPVTGQTFTPNAGCSWKNDYKKYQKLVQDGRIVFGVSGEGGPLRKRYLNEALERGKVANTWWDDVGTTTNGTQTVKQIFKGNALFSNPKPVDLVKRIIKLGDYNKNGIILDFFSGSGTTAHAVMQLNADDGGKRRCISVQLPEPTEEKSEAFKAGFKNIAEISKERIRRAGKKIKEEHPETDLDIGFRVLKVDTSNMEDVYYRPDEIVQADLLAKVDNIKSDRTAEDLLFQVLLDWGVDMTLPIVQETIVGKTVYFVDDDALAACFEKDIDVKLVRELAQRHPMRVVFRDNGFVNDSVKINVTQIFKLMSPDTDIRTI